MPILLTTDLHLTDQARDEYRFGLFPWLRKQVKRLNVDCLIILGDLTDKKDEHNARLTNRIVNELRHTARYTNIVILRGNHDAIDPECPFFLFLDKTPNIRFIANPQLLILNDKKCLCLPHSRDPLRDWKSQKIAEQKLDFIFMHQTLNGAVSENGTLLKGLKRKMFSKVKCSIYSGDVHVPQRTGKITYVGSPYHIHFGDSFEPRLVLLKDNGKRSNLHFHTISKPTISIVNPEDLEDSGLKKGDQVKVRLQLADADLPDWKMHKKKIQEIAKKLDVELVQVEIKKYKRKALANEPVESMDQVQTDPRLIFKTFCRSQGLDPHVKRAGKNVLKKVIS